MAESSGKARYYWAVLYPENMRNNWQNDIDLLVQVPYAYCIHDKDDLSDSFVPDSMRMVLKHKRKEHLHMILAFPNTTTRNHALEVFKALNAPGLSAIPGDYIQSIFNVRKAYDYLIHDTEDARKKNKYQYDKTERITGNCFDIGAYEQLSVADKDMIRKDLAKLIIKEGFTNYMDFYIYVLDNYVESPAYEEIASQCHGFFEKLTKGNFQKKKNSEYKDALRQFISKGDLPG